MFDLIGLENAMTRHEAELLCRKRVTRKLMEELFTAPPPPGRPPAVRLKPSRCVLTVWPAAHHLAWLGPAGPEPAPRL